MKPQPKTLNQSHCHKVALLGLAPPNKAPSCNMKHHCINQWSFCQFCNVKTRAQT